MYDILYYIYHRIGYCTILYYIPYQVVPGLCLFP